MVVCPVLPNLVRQYATLSPGAVALRTMDGRQSTYAEFNRHIEALAWRLHEAVKPGDIVGLMIEDEYLGWVALLAIARLGAASYQALPPSPGKDELARPACKLTDTEVDPAPSSLPLHRIDRSWLDGTPGGSSRAQVSPDSPARLIFTSGTTGRPKGVMVTHGMFDARLPRYIASYGMGEAPQTASFIEPAASPGLSVAMATWAQGGTLFKYELREFAEAMPTLGVKFVMASPGNLRNLISHLPRDSKPMPGLRILVVGSVLQPSVARALTLYVGSDILIRYGSTEVSSVTSGPATLEERLLGTAGRVIEGSFLEIVNEEGRSLPPGETGQIRTRAPGMAQGYFRNPEQSQKRFKGGWFYPGDLGSLSAEGVLRVDGRAEGVMNVGGVKLSAALVDNHLVQLEGVEDAGSCILYDKLNSAVLVAGAILKEGVKIADVEREGRERVIVPVRIFSVRALPRTETGKLQQELLALRLASLSKGQLRASLSQPAGQTSRRPPPRRGR